MGANIKHTLANKYTNLMNQLLTKLETQPEVKVSVATNSIAHKTRFNCYSARKRVQEFNAEMYPDTEDPRHGTSQYDDLIFSIKKGEPILTVTKMGDEDEDFKFIEEPSTDLGGTDPINDHLNTGTTTGRYRSANPNEGLNPERAKAEAGSFENASDDDLFGADPMESSEKLPLDKEGTE